ncbi:hemerythrin domain-containing protein [Naasia sp. SYSU D00948]|uniref:hemerythrin domain-containing protein n=1 Tax=Naasia sp. SYSU D00948 TaxID=2817379 RepID=UPI001B30C684|nr:hemerythrin domain-containing protein [Naasia sp. SYSU D00948]
MRSVAEQSTDELGGRMSVLARQKSDHVVLNGLLEELQGSSGSAQQHALLRIYRLVFPHAFAEESVLWPVIRRALPEGDELTLEVEREHQEVNELVTTLETLPVGDARRVPVLDRLVEVLREDVRDEEDELFPRLQTRVGRRQLQLLGVAWEVVRRIAPTRAHPVVARRPPGNVVAALPLTAVDRLRDAVDARRLRGGAAPRPALDWVSRGLTRTAHAIEHLPLLGRGEDPSTRRGDRAAGFPWGTAAGAAALVLAVVALLRRRR